MATPFRVTAEMRSKDRLVASAAYIEADLHIILTHGIDGSGKCTCSKKLCGSPGKHPIFRYFPNGVKSATQDLNLIKTALAKYPEANIATALGGRTVVDCDGEEGKDFIDKMKLPDTATVLTSRGFHLHYEGELERSIKLTKLDILTGKDRYVMLPPSRHVSGTIYRWDKNEPDQAAPVPGNLSSLNRGGSKRRVNFSAKKIGEGERNNTMFKRAISLRRLKLSDAVILAAMEAANSSECVPPLSRAELKTIIESSKRYESEGALFGRPKQIEPLPLECLWYPYFPRHAVTIIAGDPGRGKSLLLAMIIGIVTSGGTLPMADEPVSGRKVLLLSAEDNWARVTVNRLNKAGADFDNIHVMHKFRALTDERLEELGEHIRSWKPDLVVIDTLPAYMGGGRDMHRQNEVGEFIAYLNEMAEEVGCAIVALAHLNKKTTESPLFRIVGSIGFAASIRSACFLGTDPSDRTLLALAHGKSNGTPIGKSMLFQAIGGGKDKVPLLHFVGESDADADAVCRIEKGSVGRPKSEANEATEFVLQFLNTKEPRRWEELVNYAAPRSIASAGTLANVRTELTKQGLIFQVGKGRQAKWLRAESDADEE